MVQSVIGIDNCSNDINCGDLKLIYNNFNNGEGALPYGYAGKNYNEAR